MFYVYNDVKGYRHLSGLTQKQLADRVGLSRQSISNIETGVFVPSLIHCLKISKVLGASLDVLFWSTNYFYDYGDTVNVKVVDN